MLSVLHRFLPYLKEHHCEPFLVLCRRIYKDQDIPVQLMIPETGDELLQVVDVENLDGIFQDSLNIYIYMFLH